MSVSLHPSLIYSLCVILQPASCIESQACGSTSIPSLLPLVIIAQILISDDVTTTRCKRSFKKVIKLFWWRCDVIHLCLQSMQQTIYTETKKKLEKPSKYWVLKSVQFQKWLSYISHTLNTFALLEYLFYKWHSLRAIPGFVLLITLW